MRTAVLTLRREDGRVVADSVVVADTTLRRLRGMLGRKRLEPGKGMLLRPAWSIHTAFLGFSMDVVFLDPDQVVIRIDENLRPFSTASCRGAREVVELAAGECARKGLRVGDRVAWAPRTDESGEATPGALFRDGPRARVVVASQDARFVKLVRFLLEGHRLEVEVVKSPARLQERISKTSADLILIDAHGELAEALRNAHAARVERPELPIVLVNEGGSAADHPGVLLYDKWEETAEVIDAVERLLGEREGGVAPLEARG
jgi:uncharacterized protein